MRLEKIKNILNKKTLEIISKHNLDILENNLNLKSSHDLWPHKIIEYSTDVKIYTLLPTSYEYSIIKNDIEKLNIGYIIKGIMYYYWERGSYIPWHTDGVYSNSITIYLNDEWNYDYGGLFQYYDNEDVLTVIPEKNLGVLQRGDVYHSTTITKKDTPIRRTIQIFFENTTLNNSII